MRKTRVYIAGPYSKPDPCVNTNRAMMAWDALASLGYAPFCPHWKHFQHTFLPRPYEDWLAFDMEWVRLCDAVLRLPGESSGADKEVEEAKLLGLPVFCSVEEVAARVSKTRG